MVLTDSAILNYFLLGLQCKNLSIRKYKRSIVSNKLMNALKKDPILKFIGPRASTISSHFKLSGDIIGRRRGKVISFTKDCMKFNAARLTMNATDIAMILYSLRNLINSLDTLILII